MRTVLYWLVKEQYAAHWNIRKDCANLSTVDTTKETKIDTKAPRVLGPADKKTFHIREEVPDSSTVWRQWGGREVDQSPSLSGAEVPRNNRRYSKKTLHSWCKKKIARDVKKYWWLRWAHLRWTQSGSRSSGQYGCQGTDKNCCRQRTNTERWKAVKGFWDGSAEDNGKSGCGIVISRCWQDHDQRKLQCLWVLVPLWPPKWWVSVFLRASSISSYTKVWTLRVLIRASTPFSETSDVVHFRKLEGRKGVDPDKWFCPNVAEEGASEVRCREHPTFGQGWSAACALQVLHDERPW